MRLEFTKMHGAGNDFIVVDDRRGLIEHPDEVAKELCQRNFSVGADGLILVRTSEKADFQMRIFNPDGSEPEMCGNGIRCFAKFLLEKGITDKKSFDVNTNAGIIKPEVIEGGIRVDMGEPILSPREIPVISEKETVINEELEVADTTVYVTAVSMGNPHAVIFTEVETYPFEKVGEKLETNPQFPNRTNVEFVDVVSRDEINVKVWERGVGPTLACGTGACAAVVAASLNNKTEKKGYRKPTWRCLIY